MSHLPRLWSFSSSPFAGRVRVAFAEKAVPYELLEIHPIKRPARLRELNPVNRVPVLEVDGVAIRESSVILEWLEETHPDPPLWPADAAQRGWARGWAKFIDDGVSVNYFLGMRKLGFGLSPGDPEDIVAQLHGKVPGQWARIEPILAQREGPWLCGEQFTYADIAAMPVAVRMPAWTPQLAPDPEATPLVAAWLQALRDRPSASEIDAKGTRVEG